MKRGIYILIIGITSLLTSCSSHYGFTKYMGDDLYYSPDAPVQQVVLSQKRQQNIIDQREIDDAIRETRATRMDTRNIDLSNYINENGELDTQALMSDAKRELQTEGRVSKTLYSNPGYWIGGFKGNNKDLKEASRIIKRYPEGFAYTANDQDIAMNLSFDPDWNVYTMDGRYWWFPSYSNMNLYSQFLFGNYPRYIYTVVWNQPTFNSWDFDYAFNAGYNAGWYGSGWYGSGWNFGFSFGWGNSWYNPYYNNWYNPYWGGPCNGWYNSCWGPSWGYRPHWYHPHYGHYPPHWGNNHPSVRPPIANKPGHGLRPNHSNGNRPNTGGITRPTYSNRYEPSTRPNTTGTTRPGTATRPDNTVNKPATGRPTATRPSATQQNGNRNPATINRPTRQPNTSTQQRPSNNSYNSNSNRSNYNYNTNPTYNRGGGSSSGSGSGGGSYNRGGGSGGSTGGSGGVRRNR
ncbi:MAG: hypothetical protein ACRDDZ_01655 [Marinifilaceae bacterium]